MRRVRNEVAAPRRRRPGEIRDAIYTALRELGGQATVDEIQAAVEKQMGTKVPRSSVRSYLGLNEGTAFTRLGRGRYKLRGVRAVEASYTFGEAEYWHADCFDWLEECEPEQFHGHCEDKVGRGG